LLKLVFKAPVIEIFELLQSLSTKIVEIFILSKNMEGGENKEYQYQLYYSIEIEPMFASERLPTAILADLFTFALLIILLLLTLEPFILMVPIFATERLPTAMLADLLILALLMILDLDIVLPAVAVKGKVTTAATKAKRATFLMG
jgi:hypothetical protein